VPALGQGLRYHFDTYCGADPDQPNYSKPFRLESVLGSVGTPDCLSSFFHRTPTRCLNRVSVPFSMGTVLHHYRNHPMAGRRQIPLFQSPSRWGRCCIFQYFGHRAPKRKFQSPSRWGRCCIIVTVVAAVTEKFVSVPFSMGTVLHQRLRSVESSLPCVSVPFSMGTVLHLLGHFAALAMMNWVSVPFSMGTVLHLPGEPDDSDAISTSRSVSVPFSMGTVLHRAVG
jgi:hypothetical protein